jgi:hypothetical protein
MEFENILSKSFGYRLDIYRVLHGNKLCILGKSIHYYQDVSLFSEIGRLSMKSILMCVQAK